MADLARYGEVEEVTSQITGVVDFVNEKLKDGWELITVKVIETQFRVGEDGREGSYIRKRPATVYVLGKPREKKASR